MGGVTRMEAVEAVSCRQLTSSWSIEGKGRGKAQNFRDENLIWFLEGPTEK